MQYSLEKLTGNKVKISFTAPAPVFEEAVQKAYIQHRGHFQVQGFRKGKAPRKLIERLYGVTVFYDDALELLFPDAYLDAVQKEDLHPVDRPKVDVEEIQPGQDVKFTCEVFVYPEIKLGEYKGVEVARTMHTVTQEEVDARLKQEQKQMARSVDITDRAVVEGDEVNLDYSGSVDGVKFAGGTAEGQRLVIGSKSFIPGFEEQVVGMAIGEEKDITVTFPAEYHAEELKGKDAVFHIKINGIKNEELPALDDDFAADVSEFETLKDYTEDLKKKLQETADEQATSQAKQALVQKVTENAEIDIPDPMVEDKLNDQLKEMDWRLQQQGLNLARYMELTGQTEAQMRDMYRSEARNNLKTELVLAEIIKVENVEADPEKVDEMLKDYGDAMGKTLEDLKKELNENQLHYFEDRAKTNAALDMLWNSAKVTDEKEKKEPAKKADADKDETEPKKAAPKKAAAKKPAAKKAQAEE
ncbi:MAG TPA: trigger factor [Candidatus Limiplasma sp.]|nr:trigger factor [Candidatus Limiplasma sp.]HRX08091.1 trigger factor [Candidatus Limiplasma sp.]